MFMVWSGIVRCGGARRCVARHGNARRGTAWFYGVKAEGEVNRCNE